VTPSRRGVVARRVASGGCVDAAGVMMTMSAVKNMGPFPKDILRLILMLVDSYVDLNRCQLTCRTWRAVISDNAMLVRRGEDTGLQRLGRRCAARPGDG
jgi:hypothetical protein